MICRHNEGHVRGSPLREPRLCMGIRFAGKSDLLWRPGCGCKSSRTGPVAATPAIRGSAFAPFPSAWPTSRCARRLRGMGLLSRIEFVLDGSQRGAFQPIPAWAYAVGVESLQMPVVPFRSALARVRAALDRNGPSEIEEMVAFLIAASVRSLRKF